MRLRSNVQRGAHNDNQQNFLLHEDILGKDDDAVQSHFFHLKNR